MKRILIVLILLSSVFTTVLSAADEETLFSGRIEHGGFGGPVVMFSQINGHTGVIVGGRGGWIINHIITIGGGGYGLSNKVPAGPQAWGDSLALVMGYGGFEVGFIFNSDKLIHLDFHTLIGAGGTGTRLWNDDVRDEANDGSFFIVEPVLSLVLNVTHNFRIAGGVGYRYISGVDSPYFTDSDLSGTSINISFKFGHF